jgi:hypothetical protein
MSKKFISIHVLDSTIDDVAIRLANCQLDNNHDGAMDGLKVRSNDVRSILKALSETGPRVATFYLTESCGNVSVVSDYLKYPAIKEQVKWWFWGYDKHVLIASYLEDDLFEVTIFKKYKFILSYATGINLSEHKLFNIKLDANLISSIFNITPEKLEEAYNQDAYKALVNFSELFKLPLNLEVEQLSNAKGKAVEEVSFYI